MAQRRYRQARMPTEPPPTRWRLPPAEAADEHGLVGVGADLEPGTLLAAYRSGLFPMPVGGSGPVGWWSPDPRGVIPLDGLRVSRSLRRSCRRYDVRVDSCFRDVIEMCARLPRPGGWITSDIVDAYLRLHDLGWAHSVEAFDGDELVGGLYGVAIGGLFAGESMFHTRADASKVALVALADRLCSSGSHGRVLDVQWATPHLRSLGAVEVTRADYVAMVRHAVALPEPDLA
jgi:leucyl/phenylalanyl-tRNA--protein transferase